MAGTAEKPRITLVLLNYQRPQNIPIILHTIRSQSVKAEVFLWNNGTDDVSSPNIDLYHQSEQNVGCMARWKLALNATTPYVMCMDDDICFHTGEGLARILHVLDSENPNRIIGAFGACFSKKLDYNVRTEYYCRYHNAQKQRVDRMDDTHEITGSSGMVFIKRRFIEQDKSVDLVKGRIMAFRTSLLHGLAFPDEREDDIYLNAQFADGQRNVHCVPALLNDVFHELPEYQHGNWLSSGHVQSRSRALKSYFV